MRNPKIELAAESKNHTYDELYESLLLEIQTIQRQFACERDIPQDHEFWYLKDKLFKLVNDNTLQFKTVDIPIVTQTFRNRKAGTVKSDEQIDTSGDSRDKRDTGEILR